MTTDSSAVLARRTTAAKLLGTVGVLGAAAAVAGLGAFGAFTDSTTPVDTTVDSAVVSIDVGDAGSGSVPFAGGLFLAGDSRSHLVDLVNDGGTALESVTLGSWAVESSILDSDPVDGLQLTVEACSQPWDVSGSGYSCAGTSRTFYSGPILADDAALTGAASLAPGGVDHLRLVAALPTSASGDEFEGASSALNFQFTGTQRDGGAR